jgi:predicted GIY-YIG superfamily endonuclease
MTWKPSVRFDQHVSRLGGKYTRIHGVSRLAYLEEFGDLEETRAREQQIKKWNQEKKMKLISGEWGKEW